MEKYGADLTKMPADTDQINILRKLASEKGVEYERPANKQDAEEKIEKLKKKKA